ncbi:hypothetical protein [Paraburkholderia acidicola]|uniref:hypothetical protein n=1 Tax=Paraburkholderia acidicola TaxID=1912599 RepID=UPI0012FF8934|nr:hypothetical protein [Paraburkholderia acidicola]
MAGPKRLAFPGSSISVTACGYCAEDCGATKESRGIVPVARSASHFDLTGSMEPGPYVKESGLDATVYAASWSNARPQSE